MNRFESVTDGTASHSTWLPKNGNQVAGYKPLRWLMALLLVAFVAGCGNGGGGRDPILGGSISGKSLAPTVTGVAPANNEFGVGTNILIITADFSEPMAPITPANFTVICTAPLPCATQPTGSVALNAAKTRAIFTITNSPLLGLTTYTATITGAKSLTTGIALVSPFIWHFTTGVGSDNIKPKVASTIPANAAVNVPANTQITATFNKDMAPATLGATSFTLACAPSCATPSPAGNVSYVVASKTAKFTLTPAGTLLEVGKTYTARITTAATDLANNPLAGGLADPNIAADYVWTFTTKPAVLPVQVWVVSTQPADAEVNVCPSATINATFSVPMDPTTINAGNFSVTGPASTPVIATSVGLDGTGKTATFTPNALLINGDTYTATIKGDPNGIGAGVKDLAIPANTMANDKVWTFTAGPATGACAPLISSTLGVLSPFAIASAAGVTNAAAVAPDTNTVVNGDVVLDDLNSANLGAEAICNTVTVGNAGGIGLCGGNPPTINGTVISYLFPDAGITSGAIKAKLDAVYLSIAPPGGQGGTLAGATSLGCDVIGTGGGAGAGPGCAGHETLAPGVYIALNSSIGVTGVLTLDGGGNPNAQFIFQTKTPSTLTTASAATPRVAASEIRLTGGTKASNVWWQVGSSATIGTYSIFQGNVLANTSISMLTGATSCGRLLAGAVTVSGAFVFDANNPVSVPGQPFAPGGIAQTCQ
jgi:hypothetical protein